MDNSNQTNTGGDATKKAPIKKPILRSIERRELVDDLFQQSEVFNASGNVGRPTFSDSKFRSHLAEEVLASPEFNIKQFPLINFTTPDRRASAGAVMETNFESEPLVALEDLPVFTFEIERGTYDFEIDVTNDFSFLDVKLESPKQTPAPTTLEAFMSNESAVGQSENRDIGYRIYENGFFLSDLAALWKLTQDTDWKERLHDDMMQERMKTIAKDYSTYRATGRSRKFPKGARRLSQFFEFGDISLEEEANEADANYEKLYKPVMYSVTNEIAKMYSLMEAYDSLLGNLVPNDAPLQNSVTAIFKSLQDDLIPFKNSSRFAVMKKFNDLQDSLIPKSAYSKTSLMGAFESLKKTLSPRHSIMTAITKMNNLILQRKKKNVNVQSKETELPLSLESQDENYNVIALQLRMLQLRLSNKDNGDIEEESSEDKSNEMEMMKTERVIRMINMLAYIDMKLSEILARSNWTSTTSVVELENLEQKFQPILLECLHHMGANSTSLSEMQYFPFDMATLTNGNNEFITGESSSDAWLFVTLSKLKIMFLQMKDTLKLNNPNSVTKRMQERRQSRHRSLSMLGRRKSSSVPESSPEQEPIVPVVAPRIPKTRKHKSKKAVEYQSDSGSNASSATIPEIPSFIKVVSPEITKSNGEDSADTMSVDFEADDEKSVIDMIDIPSAEEIVPTDNEDNNHGGIPPANPLKRKQDSVGDASMKSKMTKRSSDPGPSISLGRTTNRRPISGGRPSSRRNSTERNPHNLVPEAVGESLPQPQPIDIEFTKAHKAYQPAFVANAPIFKINYNDQFYTVKLKSYSFKSGDKSETGRLVDLATQKLQLSSGDVENLDLYWQDEEGDLVKIGNDDDLHLAMRFHHSNDESSKKMKLWLK